VSAVHNTVATIATAAVPQSDSNHHCSIESYEQDMQGSDGGQSSFTTYNGDLLTTSITDALPPQEMRKNLVATFLLGLKEKFKLTQVTMQGIVDGISALNSQWISSLKSEVSIVT